MHKFLKVLLATALFLSGAFQMSAWSQEASVKKAMFGAGCFWGVEKILGHVPGVQSTAVGFAGGTTVDPSYQQVCQEDTGHAEVVEVVYDGKPETYKELLITFWEYHDPTTPDRQGPDVGSQYRSIVFTYDDEQTALAKKSKELLESAHIFKDPIVTEIVPASPFYRAEEYHQKYLQKNPFGYCSHHLHSKQIRQLLKEKL